MIYFFAWAISGVIGMMLGQRLDRAGVGLLLGLFFGPLGWLYIGWVMDNRKACPHCQTKINLKATVCAKCGRDVPQAAA